MKSLGSTHGLNGSTGFGFRVQQKHPLLADQLSLDTTTYSINRSSTSLSIPLISISGKTNHHTTAWDEVSNKTSRLGIRRARAFLRISLPVKSNQIKSSQANSLILSLSRLARSAPPWNKPYIYSPSLSTYTIIIIIPFPSLSLSKRTSKKTRQLFCFFLLSSHHPTT